MSQYQALRALLSLPEHLSVEAECWDPPAYSVLATKAAACMARAFEVENGHPVIPSPPLDTVGLLAWMPGHCSEKAATALIRHLQSLGLIL